MPMGIVQLSTIKNDTLYATQKTREATIYVWRTVVMLATIPKNLAARVSAGQTYAELIEWG